MEYQPTAYPFYQGKWRNFERSNNPPNPHLHGQKGKLAFVWPRDGKRNTTFGRFKDILQNQGPDMFVMRNGARPLRTSWTNRRITSWDDPDRHLYDDTRNPMFWAKRGQDEKYDFRTRKYGKTNRYTWADAYWMQPTGRKGNKQSKQNFPMAYKCNHGRWYQMFPNHRGDHGGFGPGADSMGPGFRDWDENGFGHRQGDHYADGLHFHEHPNWDFDDDLGADGQPINMFDIPYDFHG